ncbi:ATP-binding protein [Streptomyces sp. NPDC059785]|uniref:ATP-binding protein n=1 Tax=Streptomyces sp. NPDC059785 TaxID=3346945 RepID=UPI00366182F6
MSRKPWDLAFSADPAEVAGLRRIMRLHLGIWGLHHIADDAQLCVSELVANVIAHVGVGTPATLAVSMSGEHLRIEVHDPDVRASPTLLQPNLEAEGGRGMALVDAIADRWGVELKLDRKATWCELATGLTAPGSHVDGPGVLRAEALLATYLEREPFLRVSLGPAGRAAAEKSVIKLVTDVLHWLHAHGCDVDEALDQAQTRFEAGLGNC